MIEPPTSLETDRMPTFEDRRDFFCVGNFRHAPNWDGVQWLKAEIWPLVRKRLPDARLHIAGAYASGEQMALHEPRDGFFIDGRVENADLRFLESRVCLAPLRFGAGLKGKLIDAIDGALAMGEAGDGHGNGGDGDRQTGSNYGNGGNNTSCRQPSRQAADAG